MNWFNVCGVLKKWVYVHFEIILQKVSTFELSKHKIVKIFL